MGLESPRRPKIAFLSRLGVCPSLTAQIRRAVKITTGQLPDLAARAITGISAERKEVRHNAGSLRSNSRSAATPARERQRNTGKVVASLPS